MPSLPSPSALQALRAETFHWNERTRLKDATAIQAFVNARGVCLLFPVQNMDMPNIYQAVAGYDKDMTAKHDDYAISLTWNTKDSALDKRWWYYGKLLRSKATLVSLELLPCFYALSENFGNEAEDYLEEYEAGALSADAKNIYEALLRHGPLHAIDIKRKAGLYGDELKARFDKALTELQVGLKVLPVGVAEAGAWRYAFIYHIVSRWYPELPSQARKFTRSDARAAILTRHLANVLYAAPKDVARTFGWAPKDVQAAIDRLREQGMVDTDIAVPGMRGSCVLLRQPTKAAQKRARAAG
jgi:Winged helix DNA-binding domain